MWFSCGLVGEASGSVVPGLSDEVGVVSRGAVGHGKFNAEVGLAEGFKRVVDGGETDPLANRIIGDEKMELFRRGVRFSLRKSGEYSAPLLGESQSAFAENSTTIKGHMRTQSKK